MIPDEQKVEAFGRALKYGKVTIYFDGQHAGAVHPFPRDQILKRWEFDERAIVLPDSIRSPEAAGFVFLPWPSVIALTNESEGALHFHDEDADARRQNHGRHLRLVKEVA